LQTVCHRFNIYAGSCVALVLWLGPPTRYTLRCNTASIIKGLVWYISSQIFKLRYHFAVKDVHYSAFCNYFKKLKSYLLHDTLCL